MAVDKLVDSTKLNNSLEYTADRIRLKTGGSADIPFDFEGETGFGDAIDSIITGGGGGGLEYEAGTYTPANDVTDPTISFTNNHTQRPAIIAIMDVNQSTAEKNSVLIWRIFSYYDLLGEALYLSSSSQTVYARLDYGYKTSTSASHSSSNASSLGSIGNYITSSNFTISPASSNRTFMSGRTYKWIALWAPTT